MESSPGSPVSDRGLHSNDAEHSVRQELERILKSRYFRTAGRCRQFLQYVVERRLEGHPEQLKERTIGTEVFQRPADYATGDDPVVRVQAGEVRRRLEQFYQHEGVDSAVRIELPVGSYCPEFEWKATTTGQFASPLTDSSDQQATKDIPHRARRFKRTTVVGVIALVAIVLVAFSLVFHPWNRRTTLEEFWAPAFGTPQPTLICLAKGVTYRPFSSLYDLYRSSHPGTFQTEVERSNDPLPLDPNQNIRWGDMNLFSDYGVATGDVYAAIRISGALGQLHKTAQLRIGSDYTYQDLRNSPSVIVGAFNNRWTMNQMSNLHFAFVEENSRFYIREQIPNGRTWTSQAEISPTSSSRNPQPQGTDYAIIGRLLDSRTGQFTVIAAGLTGAGTAAAGEFVSTPALLDEAFRSAPPNWQKSNSLFVVKTTVTDAVAGPPTVVASYFW